MKVESRAHELSAWYIYIFKFYREKIFRKLFPIILVVSIYGLIVSILDQKSDIFDKMTSSIGQFHLIFSFIITIVVGFRVNSSYARWWEGRVLWGSLVNNSRNLALKFHNMVGYEEYPEFNQYIASFAIMLKHYLRYERDKCVEILAQLNIKCEETDHPLMLLANKMYSIIVTLRNEGKLHWEQYQSMDLHITALIDILGACERILRTPIPPAFAFFVKQALFVYALMFPFGWVDKFGYLVIPMIIVIIYVLLGLEILAEELEEPFGYDDNDLKLGVIAETISNNVIAVKNHKTF